MCPVALSALSISLTLASAAQQQRQASAERSNQRKVFEHANRTARANLGNSLTQQSLRRNQEREKATLAVQIVTRRALKSQGLALASAASEGTSGASVDALVGDFQQQQLEQLDLIDQNLEIVDQQLAQERLGSVARANAEILGAVGAGVPIPDYLSSGLKIITFTDELIRQANKNPNDEP